MSLGRDILNDYAYELMNSPDDYLIDLAENVKMYSMTHLSSALVRARELDPGSDYSKILQEEFDRRLLTYLDSIR